MKLSWWDNFKVKSISFLLWALQNFIGHTTRLKVINAQRVEELQKKGRGGILVTWHGRTFLCVYYFRKKGLFAIISLSRDGEIQNGVFRRFGWVTVRGSTSKRAVGALLEAAKRIKRGEILAFTPDGPRGPAGKVQPGTIFLAKSAGCPIIPVGVSARPRKLFGSWDSYMLPYPFSKGVIIFGEPIKVPANLHKNQIPQFCHRIEGEINRLTAEAESMFQSGAARKQKKW